jgi:serine/threonine protein kinase
MGIALRKYFKNLADYKEIRKLGRGASGEVFQYEENATGAQVAIKIISEIEEPKDQRSFIREIVVPLKLNLPGIVRLIGFRLPEPEVPALIITELMSNGTLETALKAKHDGKAIANFGPTEESKAVFGIAATMAQVHKHNAIHRDLKPGNIFLDDNWEIRIADFGLAKIVTGSVKMTMAIGSPVFMAPELFQSDLPYSLPVDVYAYGVLLYHFFTNQWVFKLGEKPVRNASQLMTKVANRERFVPRPGLIPPAFWDLIQQCWKHEADDRPSFEEIVRMMLESDDYTFEETDLEKYHEYRERMKPREEEEIVGAPGDASTLSGGLRMSALASGNRLFADEIQKSVRMSIKQGRIGEDSDATRALKRYDFTKSSLRRA